MLTGCDWLIFHFILSIYEHLLHLSVGLMFSPDAGSSECFIINTACCVGGGMWSTGVHTSDLQSKSHTCSQSLRFISTRSAPGIWLPAERGLCAGLGTLATQKFTLIFYSYLIALLHLTLKDERRREAVRWSQGVIKLREKNNIRVNMFRVQGIFTAAIPNPRKPSSQPKTNQR